ncbi:MAG: hypothetical protein VX181_13740 [Pseudomonadota bacterium]|nr:hypothetical protein [Pseudomonadota bacterium]
MSRYLSAYRTHQGFHEQCVDQIYTDLMTLSPESLQVTAYFQRRGGAAAAGAGTVNHPAGIDHIHLWEGLGQFAQRVPMGGGAVAVQQPRRRQQPGSGVQPRQHLKPPGRRAQAAAQFRRVELMVAIAGHDQQRRARGLARQGFGLHG